MHQTIDMTRSQLNAQTCTRIRCPDSNAMISSLLHGSIHLVFHCYQTQRTASRFHGWCFCTWYQTPALTDDMHTAILPATRSTLTCLCIHEPVRTCVLRYPGIWSLWHAGESYEMSLMCLTTITSKYAWDIVHVQLHSSCMKQLHDMCTALYTNTRQARAAGPV